MNRARFEAVVEAALREIPEELREKLRNIEVVVEARPSRALLEELELDPEVDSLYGLYQGTPLTERAFDEIARLPDKISIYQVPLEEDFGDDVEALKREIRTTVVHEIAHYFGIDDDDLDEMGY